MSGLVCPECGNADQGKMMGHEVRGIYDGVLYWECQSCGWAWPRDFGRTGRTELSRYHADQHNAGGSAGVTRR